MPQVCKVCTHPRRDDINADVIAGVPLRQLADKYKTPENSLSYSGIRYHKKHHLQDEVALIAQKAQEATEQTVYSTLEVLNKIINQHPNVVESASLNIILAALKQRSTILGEEATPPRVIIEWSLPFDKEYFERIQKGYQTTKELPVEADYAIIRSDETDDEDEEADIAIV